MTLQSQRMIGAAIAIVAILAIVIALVVQPIGEWGVWGIIIGFITLLFVFIGLLSIVSKNPNILMGRNYNERSRKWTTIALVLIGIALILMVIGGFMSGWTATVVLQVGIFAALEVMMIGALMATRSKAA